MKRSIVLSILTCLLIVFGGFAFSMGEILLIVPENYSTMKASEKRDFVWEKGIEGFEFNPAEELPAYDDIDVLGMAFGKMKRKMDHYSDFAHTRWKKYIHRRAVVAKVRYIPHQNNSYTGIFNSGAIGLLRASLTYKTEKRGVAPGLALKFFTDGNQSQDVSLLTSLDSQGQDYRFFKETFSNIVVPSKSKKAKVIAAIFKRADKNYNLIGLQHFGRINSDGTLIDKEESRAPFAIFVKLDSEYEKYFSQVGGHDVRNDFLAIEEVEQVFLRVYARRVESREDYLKLTENKMDFLKSDAREIGVITLESRFVASSFGDDQLFFRHERF